MARKWKNLDVELNLDATADTFQFSSSKGWGKGGKSRLEQPAPEPTPEPAPEPTPEPDPTPSSAGDAGFEAIEAEILRLLMDYRTQKLGRDAVLENDARINNVAEDWSVTLANENAMYHNPGLKADLADEGYEAPIATEIAGGGFGGSAQRVVDAWIASSGHEAQIVNPNVEDIGIGHYYKSGTTYGHYYTVVFATEADLLV